MILPLIVKIGIVPAVIAVANVNVLLELFCAPVRAIIVNGVPTPLEPDVPEVPPVPPVPPPPLVAVTIPLVAYK